MCYNNSQYRALYNNHDNALGQIVLALILYNCTMLHNVTLLEKQNTTVMKQDIFSQDMGFLEYSQSTLRNQFYSWLVC